MVNNFCCLRDMLQADEGCV